MFRVIMSALLSVLALPVILTGPGWAEDRKPPNSPPILAPFYVGPPIQYEDCEMLLIVFKTTPDVVKQLVPEPLKPDERNIMFAYVSRLNIVKPVVRSYHEAGIGVRVKLSDKPGNYAVCMYLDKADAISAGREIFGFSKRDGRITFNRSDDSVVGEVVRKGKTLLKTKLKITKRLDSVPVKRSVTWYNMKIIPSPKKNAKPDVMQLTSVLSNSEQKKIHIGSGELEFGSSPSDSLGKIKIEKILLSQFIVSDMRLGYGDVVHDFLKE